MASLEVNTREDCDDVFAAKNLQKFGINPRILRRQIPKGFIDVISCIGNNFDTAQSKFMNINFMTYRNFLEVMYCFENMGKPCLCCKYLRGAKTYVTLITWIYTIQLELEVLRVS